MTEIDFHFNIPDKVGYACRLLRKAVRTRGLRVVLVADAQMLDSIDEALWTFSATDFVAHCRSDGEPHQVSRSPVVLVHNSAEALTHRQVLVNLGAQLPHGFERFERLIDIVSSQDADRVAARKRWRHYSDRGYAIQRHDAVEGAAS